MPKVHTPIGVFPTQIAAAKALKCDRSTLAKRMRSDPEQYWQEDVNPRVLPPWGEYRYMSQDDKENIYQTWCKNHSLDPDVEGTANAFFDAMDAVGVPEAPEVEAEEEEEI